MAGHTNIGRLSATVSDKSRGHKHKKVPYNAKLQRKWYLTVLKLRVLLTFSVYITFPVCIVVTGFITAAQLIDRHTTTTRYAFVVCTPQQTLIVLFTRSTRLPGTVTRFGLRSYIALRQNLQQPSVSSSETQPPCTRLSSFRAL